MKLNLDEKISAAQTVAIAGHVKPDGDLSLIHISGAG